MNANNDLQQKVQFALFWEPHLTGAAIGVTAHDGIVTLSGTVARYEMKADIEQTVKKVRGVRAVVMHINVQEHPEATNEERLAEEALRALELHTSIPPKHIKIVVANGWIYLVGSVDWHYQKQAAEKAVSRIMGVKGVVNSLLIHSDRTDMLEKKALCDAFDRSSILRGKNIIVGVHQNEVTLTGIVDSLVQKEEAERIAWNAPGIWRIHNQLEIIHT
ncbi:BON domain-containing protein [Flavobacterium sp.]|uniref:BON domain-containing protein n=1 Tax=Flavobacterium sp. TaxID=239 RepID=UPI00261BDCD5|nr:BON domain-containing protein [Flavobacterium sp.]